MLSLSTAFTNLSTCVATLLTFVLSPSTEPVMSRCNSLTAITTRPIVFTSGVNSVVRCDAISFMVACQSVFSFSRSAACWLLLRPNTTSANTVIENISMMAINSDTTASFVSSSCCAAESS